MKITLNIENELLNRAIKVIGVKDQNQLVKLGLEALIARESAKRLAQLGGTEKALYAVPRRGNFVGRRGGSRTAPTKTEDKH